MRRRLKGVGEQKFTGLGGSGKAGRAGQPCGIAGADSALVNPWDR